LLTDDYPFLRHAFLRAAEDSGSVAPATGWTPRHLTLYQDGVLRGAMPLYEKSHSWGEFVFDWAWAEAYQRAGLEYYPKLVSTVPFTPAPSTRLLLRDAADQEAAKLLLRSALQLAEDSDCSSLHPLFPTAPDLQICRELQLQVRKDCQFHWHNRDYDDFNSFVRGFSAAKRKKVRQDRRRVADAGVTFRRLHGGNMSASDWHRVYELISVTFRRRGMMPYFDLQFFLAISNTLPDNVLVVLAEKAGTTIAAAVFFESPHTLYGRYWGSDGYYDALHFETCYYQGIEYCIETGKAVFEPGTQGEHKIARGFSPATTWSAHWLRHPEFFTAVGAYISKEARHVERYMQAVDEHSPYRRDRKDET
jgi:predicted N-acyltransferase